jgi:hypothetical protein
LTTIGTLIGLANFTTDGTVRVPSLKNTLAGSGTATITVTLVGVSGGYLETTTTTITIPSGTVIGNANAGVVDAASLQVNESAPARTLSTTTTTAWTDVTRPTITGCVLTDTYYNDSALVADGTFHSGQDGKVDTLTCTASETLKTVADSASSRDDWSVAGLANEYGTSLTVIKATASGTTFTINFSGALTNYATSTLNLINTQGTTPSFMDTVGHPLATGLTGQTYRVCMTGFTCTGSDFGNSAVITASITQPSAAPAPVVSSGGGGGGGSSSSSSPSAAVKTDTTKDTVKTDTTKDTTTDTTKDVVKDEVKADDKTVTPAVTVKLTDTDKSWAKTEIQTMVDKGIVKGNADGTFKPDANLLRADAAVLICRVMGIDEKKVVDVDPFSDVKAKGNYFGSCVSQLKSAKIVNGNPDGTFKFGSNVARAEFIALALRAYGTFLTGADLEAFNAMMNAKEPKASFKDVDVKNDWYANVATTSKEKEFVNGRACGKDKCFDGGKNITRAEATTVLYRIFNPLLK